MLRNICSGSYFCWAFLRHDIFLGRRQFAEAVLRRNAVAGEHFCWAVRRRCCFGGSTASGEYVCWGTFLLGGIFAREYSCKIRPLLVHHLSRSACGTDVCKGPIYWRIFLHRLICCRPACLQLYQNLKSPGSALTPKLGS